VFKVVNSVLEYTRIFNLHFINKVKHAGTNRAFKKLRLVMQAYNNYKKEQVLT